MELITRIDTQSVRLERIVVWFSREWATFFKPFIGLRRLNWRLRIDYWADIIARTDIYSRASKWAADKEQSVRLPGVCWRPVLCLTWQRFAWIWRHVYVGLSRNDRALRDKLNWAVFATYFCLRNQWIETQVVKLGPRTASWLSSVVEQRVFNHERWFNGVVGSCCSDSGSIYGVNLLEESNLRGFYVGDVFGLSR